MRFYGTREELDGAIDGAPPTAGYRLLVKEIPTDDPARFK